MLKALLTNLTPANTLTFNILAEASHKVAKRNSILFTSCVQLEKQMRLEKKNILISSITILMIAIGCSDKKEVSTLSEVDGWRKESQVIKTIKNVNFNFPDSGYAFNNKNAFIEECFDAIQSNSKLIGLDSFNDTIQIRFLASRDDMFWLTRSNASGIAYPHINTLYVVADGKNSPPIKHELLHLIAMLNWGYPHNSSTWINEGLATYSGNNCNQYNVAEIYRYLLKKEMLIPVDSLATNFYEQPEMIAYHQSAYIVQHLLNNYKLEQFIELWTKGFDSFQTIYGNSFKEMKAELEKVIIDEYPETPEIEWETFKEGCK